MFCKAYHQSLRDAAASGEALSPVLRKHLASCESCRAAFAEEQCLFAAIDSGLQASANSEVPATLIPGVRVGIAQEPQHRVSFPSWAFIGGAFATAAVAVTLLVPSHHPPNSPKVTGYAVSSTRPIESFPVAAAVNPPQKSGVSVVKGTKWATLVASNNSTQRFPEVIVPPEEGVALLRYEELLHRKQAVVLMASAKSLDLRPGIEPLQIAEIEFVDLKIPALSKWESEDDTK